MAKNRKTETVNEDVKKFLENFKETYAQILFSLDELLPIKRQLRGMGYYKEINHDFPSLLTSDLDPKIESTVEKQKDNMWKFFDLGDHAGSVFNDIKIKSGIKNKLNDEYLKLIEEKIQNGYNFIKKIKAQSTGNIYTAEEFEKIYFAKIILRSHLYEKYYLYRDEVDKYEVIKELNSLDLESIAIKNGVVYVIRDSIEKLENNLSQGFASDITNLRKETDVLNYLNKYTERLQDLFDNDFEKFEQVCQHIIKREKISNFKKFMIVNFNIRGKRKFYDLLEKKEYFRIKKVKNLSVVYIDNKLISVNNQVFENIINELENMAKSVSITRESSDIKVLFTNKETRELDKIYFKELIVEINSLMSKAVVYGNNPDSIRQVYQKKFGEIRERYLHEIILLREKSEGVIVRNKPKI